MVFLNTMKKKCNRGLVSRYLKINWKLQYNSLYIFFQFLFALYSLIYFKKWLSPFLNVKLHQRGYFMRSIFLNSLVKIKFTYHTFHPLKVYNGFNLFVTPKKKKKNPISISSHSPLPKLLHSHPHSPSFPQLKTFCLYRFAYSLHFRVDEVIYYVVSYDWLSFT